MMAAFVARRSFTALKFVSSPRFLPTFQIQKRQFSFSKCLSSHLYTEKHEWIVMDSQKGTVGISDHAQDQLGEIVYVESPEIGAQLQAGDVAGCLESVKAASDIYSPLGGVVTEVNEELKDNPSLVNQKPLGGGWLYKMNVDSGSDTSGLMDQAAYDKFLENADH